MTGRVAAVMQGHLLDRSGGRYVSVAVKVDKMRGCCAVAGPRRRWRRLRARRAIFCLEQLNTAAMFQHGSWHRTLSGRGDTTQVVRTWRDTA
jgi:hypothetical protein